MNALGITIAVLMQIASIIMDHSLVLVRAGLKAMATAVHVWKMHFCVYFVNTNIFIT